MKTEVRDTSIETFYQDQKKMARRELELFNVLKAIQPASDRDLGKALGWELGSVAGRRNGLLKQDLVEVDHKAISPITSKRVTYWRIKIQENLPL